MTQHYSQVRHPVRQIPTKEQLEYAARRQAQYEANEEADPSYSGHSAGLHPEHNPYISTDLSNKPASFHVDCDYELEEDDEYYNTRLPTSSRRYQVSPEQIYQPGNTRLHVRYVDVPKRKSRQQLPPPRERYTEEYETVLPRTKQGIRLHPVAWLGIFG